MTPSQAYVTWARLELAPGTDAAAVGAGVTTELCGHWEHEPPCRWPHNNDYVDGVFRTLFASPAPEAGEVRRRIEAALQAGAGWTVHEVGSRDVLDAERDLADRLCALPRRAPDAG
jgi:hypothetical protein